MARVRSVYLMRAWKLASPTVIFMELGIEEATALRDIAFLWLESDRWQDAGARALDVATSLRDATFEGLLESSVSNTLDSSPPAR